MVYSLPHGLHGGLRSAVQKILLAWVFRWHLVDLPPSRVFSAADAALSLGSAESGKSKECRGMCFSRIRSKGSRFTLGVWGLRCVRSTLHSRSQPFATVRNRPQVFARSPYGRAYGKFCRGGPFWGLQTCRCFVSRGRRGTSWHSDVFCNVSKVVLCGRRNTFATFSEDALQFSWQAQHFGRVHLHFAWQAQHFRRVMLRVFCESHCQGFVKWGRRANWVASVAFTEMCWKLTEASRETSILRSQILRFMRKRVGKRRFWSYEVWKLEEVSHEMVVLRLQHVSSRVSGFPVALPCLWGKLQNLSFWRRESRSGCHVVLRGRGGTSSHSRVWKTVETRSVWQVRYFCVVFRRWVGFLVAGETLCTSL